MVTKDDLKIVDILRGIFEINLDDQTIRIVKGPNRIVFSNCMELAFIVSDTRNTGVIIISKDVVARYEMLPNGSYQVLHYTDKHDRHGVYEKIDPIDYVLKQLEGHSQGL